MNEKKSVKIIDMATGEQIGTKELNYPYIVITARAYDILDATFSTEKEALEYADMDWKNLLSEEQKDSIKEYYVAKIVKIDMFGNYIDLETIKTYK